MKSTLLGLAVLLAAGTAGFGAAQAADKPGPAVIYDLGGKFDKSFNEGAYNGAERWKKESGKTYRDFEITNASQREQALRRFAKDGNDPIIVMGFAYEDVLAKVAKAYPKVHFGIVDSVVDLPNVASYVYRADEGSYLAGYLAAKTTKTGTIGFIGGMDVPLIRNFGCGYVQGAKAANPQIKVIQNMTGTTPAAWNDPGRGAELTKAQISQGADIVYAAAGQTGLGVLQAAADGGKLGIGVDSNQNGLHPGKVLTSVLKRVDEAIYQGFKDGEEGKFKAGTHVLGIKDSGVALAMDDNNKPLVTDANKAAIEAVTKDIADGKVVVHNYEKDNVCPVN
ncbi:BMP family ABC transporter substrate-binding protein [Labrys sp. LIt4]|uniref:BMP family ABC transporter substrate-binding protein n=1 Tax=Labrys okinawensis TaxID=346911 RepID=A0A2S9Q7J7_9HYPH|nr:MULTISPECIES: BMP family ABC transporter substrate-binding protein [Labrys]MBP0577812.1 BMP family ABC transporter substrate-binding protein [Labrys sp. LIt4]PRH85274.1 BMP family ABC transporter substrate-binding protein [Labrys okinawensis]